MEVDLVRTLECADCHVSIKAEIVHAYEFMRCHVREHHGRDLIFSLEQYKRLTLATKIASISILKPELMIAS